MMSSEIKRRSPAEWFLESFFQERNIKWMLALGVMIVFGSSLMLVTKQWDHWAPLWKALTVIGYSAAVFGCGELCHDRLGLRNTGTVMRTLTLLLLPLSFLAIHRIGLTDSAAESIGWFVRGEQIGLLLLDVVLTAFASRRIFSQFLRGSQPTLVASYVALAAAGGVLSPMSTAVTPVVALVLWMIFAIGTVKTARQVFWLAEEHRLPRVCGFLPITVLGTQFLTLFVLSCWGQMALPWIGLGCVLTAVPVLFTTDAIAKVFQQRTGDLVRPLPWSIVLPLFIGLVLCFVGVGLSAIGFPFSLALAPAAGLAAVMMLMTARRTGHQAFVWAGLIATAIAYQSVPAYFRDTAKLLVNSAATAVHEPRLPVAFYGLTWLPLILSATFASARAARRGDRLIEVPTRRFAMLVAMLLFAVCFTHAKAIFPVSAVMTAAFLLQAKLFGNRRLLVGSAAAWIAVCVSARVFLSSVCGLPITTETHQLLMTAGAAVLLIAGSWLDLVLRTPTSGRSDVGVRSTTAWPIFGIASVLFALGVAGYWLGNEMVSSATSFGTFIGITLAALLMAQAWKWPSRGLGEAAWSFVLAGIVKVTLPIGWLRHLDADVVLLLWTLAPLALWIAGRLVDSFGSRGMLFEKLAGALGRPALRVSAVALLLMTALAHGLFLIAQADHPLGHLLPIWLPALLLLAWPFDAARRFQQRGLSVLGCSSVLSFVAIALLEPATMRFIPVAWGMLSAVGMLMTSWQRRDEVDDDPSDMIRAPIHAVTFGVLLLMAVLTLLSFEMTLRLAGMIAVVALALASLRREHRDRLWVVVAIGHWQVTAFVAKCLAPELVGLFDVVSAAMSLAVLPVALTLAAGLSVIRLRPREEVGQELLGIHCFVAYVVLASSLIAGLLLPLAALSIGQVAAAIATFALLVITEFVLAVRQQRTDRVWMAQGLIGAAIVWLLLAGVIELGHGWAMFGCLGAAVAWTVASRVCAHIPQTRFAAEALDVPANLLPLAAAMIGVVRHVTHGESDVVGLHSLGLLLSAAFYFWQGLETADDAEHQTIRRDRFVVSAIILNVASALLWRELHWSDPQFFMIPAGLTILGLVELLKREIPERYHDSLRYAGALTILVSPTFHIVSGSWLHLISLMVCSVLIALLAIGLRLRVLVYSGTAFLIADLFAMVIRGSIDHPNLLWLAGLGIGAAVITLGAICENHRESLLTRLRVMAAELQTWK